MHRVLFETPIEFFPFVGKISDNIFLLWGDFGFLLGENVYFSFTSQYWEYAVNFAQVIPKVGNNMGTFPKLFPI